MTAATTQKDAKKRKASAKGKGKAATAWAAGVGFGGDAGHINRNAVQKAHAEEAKQDSKLQQVFDELSVVLAGMLARDAATLADTPLKGPRGELVMLTLLHESPLNSTFLSVRLAAIS